MKDKITTAIKDAVSELDASSKKPLVEFLNYLDKVELYSILTNTGITNITNVIYSRKVIVDGVELSIQGPVLDTVCLISANLIQQGLRFDDLKNIFDANTKLISTSQSLESNLKKSLTPVVYDNFIMVIYLMKLNIRLIAIKLQ